MSTSSPKLCFAASSGGHYEQLMMLKPLMERYDSFVLTERTQYQAKDKGTRTYYVPQINRKERMVLLKLIGNGFRCLGIFLKERPDVIICTGVLAMLPMCLLMKLFGRKLIYIESFAKVTSATESGQLLYRFADRCYVQWDSMKRSYPNAICLGSIY